MASLECKGVDLGRPSAAIGHLQALADIDRQLELANENENLVERTLSLDRLLEEQDWLMTELEASVPKSETKNDGGN